MSEKERRKRDYEALVQGSISHNKKLAEYAANRKKIKARQKTLLEYEHFGETGLYEAWNIFDSYSTLVDREKRGIIESADDTLDYLLAMSYEYLESDFSSVTGIKKQMKAFYETYGDELHDTFYKDGDRNLPDPVKFLDFQDFASEAMHSHMSYTAYDSDEVNIYFDRVRTKEEVAQMTQDELYEDFFIWVESLREDIRQRSGFSAPRGSGKQWKI